MTAADNSNVVQFASPADAIGDLIERLVDATVRLSQLEAMAADGTDIFERLAAFDARLTALEKRQRRPPPFPVELHVNKTQKVDFRQHYEQGERFYALRSDLNEQDKRLKALEARVVVVGDPNGGP
jgi:hypothetical protein